jgi:hypothetical protein
MQERIKRVAGYLVLRPCDCIAKLVPGLLACAVPLVVHAALPGLDLPA